MSSRSQRLLESCKKFDEFGYSYHKNECDCGASACLDAGVNMGDVTDGVDMVGLSNAMTLGCNVDRGVKRKGGSRASRLLKSIREIKNEGLIDTISDMANKVTGGNDDDKVVLEVNKKVTQGQVNAMKDAAVVANALDVATDDEAKAVVDVADKITKNGNN